ncbi:MAG: YlzJ-like family protein [Bacillota bacterium]
MLYYSIYPWENVMEEEPLNNIDEYDAGGHHICYENLPNGFVRIIRIIGTDPRLYLDQRLQPGKIISVHELKN